jgi:hypothetical protein
MPKFIPVVDPNTKNVYKWIKLDDNGIKTTHNVSSAHWKSEHLWDDSEVAALFGETIAVSTEQQEEPATEVVEIGETIVDETSSDTGEDSNFPTFLGVTNT